MMDQQLPSTPQSPDDQHPGGLMRVRHNNAQYHGSPQANSDFSGTYGSPASSQWAHDPYLSDPQPLFDDYAQPGDGFGPEYGNEWHGGPMRNMYPFPAPYGEIHRQQAYRSVPPTPAVSDRSAYFRALAPSKSAQSRLGTETRPKAKKPSKAKDKSQAPDITEPLSVLTKESKVPLKNTEEYVNRPAEQRVADLGKRKSIPRPMNSFMLYRSAYTERAKEWCDRNNHQIVSKIAGQSWALESPEIRERFAELARIERDNHQAAHPNYKFQPSKASAGMKKPRGAHSDLLGDDASETNESDLDWSPHGHKRPRQRSQRRDDYGSPLGLGGNLYESPTYNRILQRGLNRSQFRASNPTQQLPMPMGAMGRNGEYLSRHVYPTVTGGTRVEDVAYHSTPIPGGPMMLERAAAQSQHEMVPMHAPIAGIAHNDLLVMDEAREQADQAGGHNIDPLLGANDGFHGSLNAESFEQWEDNNLSQLISDNQADIELKNYDFQAGGDIHAYDPFQGGPGGLPE